jgi:hypothetical protein
MGDLAGDRAALQLGFATHDLHDVVTKLDGLGHGSPPENKVAFCHLVFKRALQCSAWLAGDRNPMDILIDTLRVQIARAWQLAAGGLVVVEETAVSADGPQQGAIVAVASDTASKWLDSTAVGGAP